ncbi:MULTISPECIES: c-type cytochrome [unclassified Iodidimonas]|jgi:cytochrome c|nr:MULTISPECIES: c-type cytochrome [unclassified Iodidimonas]
MPGGDAERGRILFFSCKACHDLAPADIHMTDDSKPNLFGLFGRRVGFDPNYQHYSATLKDADFIWTEDRLDQWLKSPNSLLPGNKMPFSGIMKDQDRLDLIAYLRQFKADPPPDAVMTIK